MRTGLVVAALFSVNTMAAVFLPIAADLADSASRARSTGACAARCCFVQEPVRVGNDNFTAAPSGTFSTGDGLLNIAANEQRQFTALCRVVERPELATDPRFAERADRKANRQQLTEELEKALAARPAQEWESALAAAGVPAARVLTVPEALAHEQVSAREFIHDLPFPSHPERPLRVLGSPVHVRGAAPGPHSPPPLLGEHTDALLRELGYSAAEIADLREEGAV